MRGLISIFFWNLVWNLVLRWRTIYTFPKLHLIYHFPTMFPAKALSCHSKKRTLQHLIPIREKYTDFKNADKNKKKNLQTNMKNSPLSISIIFLNYADDRIFWIIPFECPSTIRLSISHFRGDVLAYQHPTTKHNVGKAIEQNSMMNNFQVAYELAKRIFRSFTLFWRR